jgi:hypothetical protein
VSSWHDKYTIPGMRPAAVRLRVPTEISIDQGELPGLTSSQVCLHLALVAFHCSLPAIQIYVIPRESTAKGQRLLDRGCHCCYGCRRHPHQRFGQQRAPRRFNACNGELEQCVRACMLAANAVWFPIKYIPKLTVP